MNGVDENLNLCSDERETLMCRERERVCVFFWGDAKCMTEGREMVLLFLNIYHSLIILLSLFTLNVLSICLCFYFSRCLFSNHIGFLGIFLSTFHYFVILLGLEFAKE